MPPTIGRIVHFHPNVTAAALLQTQGGGNPVVAFQPVAAVIVRTWGTQETSAVNLKVLTDGPNDVWLTSVPGVVDAEQAQANGNSYWAWPPRV